MIIVNRMYIYINRNNIFCIHVFMTVLDAKVILIVPFRRKIVSVIFNLVVSAY